VKLVTRDGDRWTFQLRRQEKALLLDLLQRYPVLDPAFQPLSKTADLAQRQADQELLHEALAAQQEENRRMLHDLLGEGQCFSRVERGWRFTLEGRQVETLLQMLNDIRVGSWRNLGCPDAGQTSSPEITEANLRSLYAMELSGFFQTHLLAALESRG
jgi:hypothetical protein